MIWELRTFRPCPREMFLKALSFALKLQSPVLPPAVVNVNLWGGIWNMGF